VFLEYQSVMAPKKHLGDIKTRSKRANDPTSYQGDNIQRFLSSFSNRAIVVEKGLENDLITFSIYTIFNQLGWITLFDLKKPIYLKLIEMFFINMRITMEPKISSNIQDKPIEFNCQLLANDYRAFEMPIIEGFVYDEGLLK